MPSAVCGVQAGAGMGAAVASASTIRSWRSAYRVRVSSPGQIVSSVAGTLGSEAHRTVTPSGVTSASRYRQGPAIWRGRGKVTDLPPVFHSIPGPYSPRAPLTGTITPGLKLTTVGSGSFPGADGDGVSRK